MGLEQLSNEELLALKAGDYSKLSNESLAALSENAGTGGVPSAASMGDDLEEQIKPLPKEINPTVAALAGEAFSFPSGSKERSRVLGDASKVETLLGAKPPPKLIAGIKADDVAAIVDAQNLLKDLMAFKSRGFGGKGIDTGPLVGSTLPWTDIPLYPSGLSEFINRKSGEGEDAADRAELRRKTMSLLNPVRKEVTGAAASMQELMKFIFPVLPTESDNDLSFYQKGLGTLEESQSRLRTLLDSIERAGSADVSGFRDIRNKKPDQLVNELLEQVTQGLSLDAEGNVVGSGEYGFGTLMPDTTKNFLQRRNPVKTKMSDEELLKQLSDL